MAGRHVDKARTTATGRFTLAYRSRGADTAQMRVRFARRPHDEAGRAARVGRLNVYRPALASWYGPGLYGDNARLRRHACRTGTMGVAHKSLPCGTKRHAPRKGSASSAPASSTAARTSAPASST